MRQRAHTLNWKMLWWHALSTMHTRQHYEVSCILCRRRLRSWVSRPDAASTARPHAPSCATSPCAHVDAVRCVTTATNLNQSRKRRHVAAEGWQGGGPVPGCKLQELVHSALGSRYRGRERLQRLVAKCYATCGQVVARGKHALGKVRIGQLKLAKLCLQRPQDSVLQQDVQANTANYSRAHKRGRPAPCPDWRCAVQCADGRDIEPGAFSVALDCRGREMACDQRGCVPM